ncbi:MAG: hypothetical protein OEY14_17495 [Myxococcales bacterium]|nr:hypothetical protein [Myxococcales bacterium]
MRRPGSGTLAMSALVLMLGVSWGCGRTDPTPVHWGADAARPDGGAPDAAMPDASEDALVCARDAQCDDGRFCNGAERCVMGACVTGAPESCDDGISCTLDRCDEEARACASIPDDTRCDAASSCDATVGCLGRACDGDAGCDDGNFCNGEERCVDGRCALGAPIDCDDGVACTADLCDGPSRRCVHFGQDSLCNDRRFCNGEERCVPELGCRPALSLPCEDGDACTDDGCDEATDACVSTPRCADPSCAMDPRCSPLDCSPAGWSRCRTDAECAPVSSDCCCPCSSGGFEIAIRAGCEEIYLDTFSRTHCEGILCEMCLDVDRCAAGARCLGGVCALIP